MGQVNTNAKELVVLLAMLVYTVLSCSPAIPAATPMRE